jgi:hypothetical protein
VNALNKQEQGAAPVAQEPFEDAEVARGQSDAVLGALGRMQLRLDLLAREQSAALDQIYAALDRISARLDEFEASDVEPDLDETLESEPPSDEPEVKEPRPSWG